MCFLGVQQKLVNDTRSRYAKGDTIMCSLLSTSIDLPNRFDILEESSALSLKWAVHRRYASPRTYHYMYQGSVGCEPQRRFRGCVTVRRSPRFAPSFMPISQFIQMSQSEYSRGLFPVIGNRIAACFATYTVVILSDHVGAAPQPNRMNPPTVISRLMSLVPSLMYIPFIFCSLP